MIESFSYSASVLARKRRQRILRTGIMSLFIATIIGISVVADLGDRKLLSAGVIVFIIFGCFVIDRSVSRVDRETARLKDTKIIGSPEQIRLLDCNREDCLLIDLQEPFDVQPRIYALGQSVIDVVQRKNGNNTVITFTTDIEKGEKLYKQYLRCKDSWPPGADAL